MGTRWRHHAFAGCTRLAVLVPAGAVAISVMISGGSAATRPPRLNAVRNQASHRPPALSRASARAAALTAALAGLRAQAEVLTQRYDHEVALARQAAAAYQVTAARLAVAVRIERHARLRLGQQAAADYEADGGQSMAAAMLAGAADPQGYLGALGIQQALAGQRADLLAASQADVTVTRLFRRQAAALLAQWRAAAQSAGFLKLAVAAAVQRQVAAVSEARAARARLAAGLASARAGKVAPAARSRSRAGEVGVSQSAPERS